MRNARSVGSKLAVATLTFGSSAPAAEVTLKLASPDDGAVVQANQVIEWSIYFRVSTSDNRGLALVSVDLAQQPTNPGDVALEPAASIASGIANFISPAGVTNLVSGQQAFGGTPLGTDCRIDLIQIGGGQNTTGTAGTGRGTSTTVVESVGHSTSDLLLASGSFAFNGQTPGVYSFSLQNEVGQVLDSAQATTPPWSVSAADVQIAGTDRTFSVIFCPGDIDQNGVVDLDDLLLVLGCFGAASSDPDWANCSAADLTGDGVVDLDDQLLVLGNQGTFCN